MNFRAVIYPKISELAVEYLKREICDLDFDPKFAFIFFTSEFYGKHTKILDFLENFIDFDSVCFFVEAFGDEKAIYSRGVSLLLFDEKVDVFKTGKGEIERELEKISERLRGYDCALAVYPTLYFPSRLELLRGLARDRLYSALYRATKKMIFIHKPSEWLLRNRIVIPINRVLKTLSKAGIPVGSINLTPMEAKVNTPLILHNFEPIGRNVLVLGFKRANIHFKDVFMKRGNSYEETFKIVKRQFAVKDSVKVRKEGVVIAEINGMSVKDYVKRLGLKEINEKEFVERLEEEGFETVTPYGLALIHRETFGVSCLGLLSTPLNFYVSFFDLDEFFDQATVVGEVLAFDPAEFVKFDVSRESKKIFFIDYSSLFEYRGEAYRIHEWLSENQKNFFIVFTSNPSAFVRSGENFLSENGRNIYYNGSGTTVLLELCDSEKG